MIKFNQIQEINSIDFAQAIEIYNNAFPENERLSLSKITEKIKEDKIQLWVTHEESKVIFIAILCPLIKTNFTLLAYIATAPNFRGKGIAKEFLLWWENNHQIDDEYLLLEVENPTIGEDKNTKEKRVKFYQKLGAKIVNQVRYFLPDLSKEKAPEMILMIYPHYNKNVIEGELIKQLIISSYEQFYDQYNHPNLNVILDLMPNQLKLS